MGAYPIFFTVEFRRKMAELPQSQLREWLDDLARRVNAAANDEGPAAGAAFPPGLDFLQEMHEVARACRLPLVESIRRQLGPFDERHLLALLEVPRESFVRLDLIAQSPDDTPLPLDASGLATISAPHAYLLSYRLLGLSAGDALVELGAGSGYGAALAAFIVGPSGRVLSFEIDSALADWARRRLGSANEVVSVVEGDAMSSAPSWGAAKKIVVTFAVEKLPRPWLKALPEGGRLVAPVGAPDGDQRLVLAAKRRGRVIESDHGAVRYVKNRSSA